MRGAFVIAGKDLRNLFFSPLFFILSGLCTVAWTFLFMFSVSDFASQAQGVMRQMGPEGEAGPNLHFMVFARHISLVNLLMIFAVAALSMRLFTEEKKNRTYDLLLTAPVTATEITIGKLIAGVLGAWGLLALSALYPLSLAFFADIQWGPLVSIIRAHVPNGHLRRDRHVRFEPDRELGARGSHGADLQRHALVPRGGG